MVWVLVLLIVLVVAVLFLVLHRRHQPSSRLDFWHTGREQ